MKKILLIVACIITALGTKAQYVTIPDANFVTFIQQNYPNCMNGNQMDTTCSAIVNASFIYLPSYSLNDIDGIQYFDNLQSLSCANNFITSLPELPIHLKSLDCSGNSLAALPSHLPDSLTALGCSHNQLHSLPTLPNTLTSLSCDYNSLSSLPTLPNTIEMIWCGSNIDLNSIDALPVNLKQLDISASNFLTLPALPEGLNTLRATYANIQTFPPLPSTLEVLDIRFSTASVLPNLPFGLRDLQIGSTGITNIPTLPPMLESFSCANNGIAALPPLPATLRSLACPNNNLTSIPQALALNYLDCSNNNIFSLGQFDDTMRYLDCSNNLNLYCLPHIKHVIMSLNFSNTSIVCLPNTITVFTPSTPSVDTMPICGHNNNLSGCTVYGNISGRSYFDRNSNCILDSSDIGEYGLKHNLYSNGILLGQAYSNSAGNYSFDVNVLGNYETRLDTTNIPFTVACPISGVYYDTLTANDSTHFNRDFALHCKQGFNLVAQSVSTAQIFRPANNTVVDIHAGDLANFYGANCAAGVAGSVTVNIIGPATYVAPATGALTPSSVAGHILTWNVADFANVNFNTSFGIVVQTDTFAQIGQQVCFELHITPTVGDNDSTNNTLLHCFNIINSYDPNDKQAYPSGLTDTADKWITYTVRFQNTGTADAQHIYIMDTLDANVDARTFQLLAYSHQPNIQVNEHIIRFNFPYINLPDSNSNEPGSHGYVQYRVKLKENLELGTQIKNTAHIYFDFNPPVVTNTTLNTITRIIPAGIQQPKVIALNVYPNPATQQLTVTTAQQGGVLNVYSTQGALLATYTMQGSAQTIDIATLASGVYYVEVNNKEGIGRKKFVKL